MQSSKKIASERIEMLFALAIEENMQHPERSDRYVEIARQISKRVRVRIPNRFRTRFCKRCGRFLSASKARVRLRKGALTVTCTYCGARKRRKYDSNTDTPPKIFSKS